MRITAFAAGVLVVVAGCGTTLVPPGQPSPQPPSPSVAPTAPSPQATSSQGAATRVWNELRWSQPGLILDDASLLDVVAWRDAYVAVGQALVGGQSVGAAFVSADGVAWERTVTFSANPTLVATATRLIALVGRPGPPPTVDLWASLDGRSWQRQETLALPGVGISSVAARGTTIVAVGTDTNGQSITLRSDDGAAWSKGSAPGVRAIVRRVAAVADGFISVGRDGEPDRGVGVGVPGIGRPAAWWSSDGRAWSALQVQGVDAPGGQLIEIFRVADGYFAIGSDTTDANASARSPLLWTSVDARDWRLVGPPSHWGMAGANGQQAVVLAYAGATANPEGWVSRDGRQWTSLAFTGDVTDIPVLQQFVGMSGHIDRMFVMPKGVLVFGQVVVQQRGQTAAWFAEGAIRP